MAGCSEQIRLNSLATTAAGRTVAINLKAVDDAYPLVGAVRLDPPLPLATALADGGGVAEAALLARLGIGIGDTVRVGDADVVIRAVLVREPDRIGGLFSLGPRLLIGRSTLDAAQVLLPGALARFEYKVALPAGVDADSFALALERSWPDAGWRASSPRDVQPQVTRVTDRLATFLTLAGLTALLTGGLGIALTIETHLARRTATIATLKSLGASGSQVFTIYLVQVMLLAIAGIVLGLALGLLLPLAVRLVPEGLLPISPDLGAHGVPVAPRRTGRAADHAGVRGMATRDRSRGVPGPAVPGARGAGATLAAPGLSRCARAGRGRTGGRGRARRATARDRRLVRAHRGRGGAAALGPHASPDARGRAVCGIAAGSHSASRSRTSIGRARPRPG